MRIVLILLFVNHFINFSQVALASPPVETMVSPPFSEEKIPYSVEKAIDERRADDPELLNLIKDAHGGAILGMGMIGDLEGCRLILSNMEKTGTPFYSSEAFGLCRHKEWVGPLIGVYESYTESGIIEIDDHMKGIVLASLGYIATDEARQFVAEKFNESMTTELQQSALSAYMQSIVYSRKSLADLPEMDWQKVLTLLGKRETAFDAIMLLSRLKDVSGLLSAHTVSWLAFDHENIEVRSVAMRLLRQYPELVAQAPIRIDDIRAINTDIRARHLYLPYIEASKALNTDKAIANLVELVNLGGSQFRLSALKALADKIDNAKVAAAYEKALMDPAVSVRVQAVLGLYAHDASKWQSQFERMVTETEYYPAYKAASQLMGDDVKKAQLRALLPKMKNETLKEGMTSYLSGEVEEEKIRPTPSEIIKEEGATIVRLVTSKGEITLLMDTSRMAARHYVDLVKAGGLDGMIWHRVIPNFVAQAGETENPVALDWGSIRDEWGGEHRAGSIGLATSGKDTGSAQFFINLVNNATLNGRYTVFGQIGFGFDVAYMLEEGDKIISAEVINVTR